MRYIGISILLVLCLTLLLLTGCITNTVTPEIASGNLENEDTEEPVIEDTGETKTVYPQQWATGDGTVENPWANNCINKALDFVSDGGTIFLKAGHYTLLANLELNKKINIVGEGRNKTVIKTVGNFGFIVMHDYCTLKGMTIDGDTQTDRKDLSCINIRDCDHITLEDIEAKNSFTGIQIFRVNHSSFKNIYVHDNYRHGLLLLGSDTAGNTYKDIYAWNNGKEEDTVTPEIAIGNLENQEDINQSSNNSQSSSTDPVEEPATEEPGTIEVDTTKPVITGSRDPLPNSFGWNNTDVTVSFSCADTGPVQSGIEINTVAGETVTTEGKNQSVTNTGVCTDAAGNTADPVTVSNINIDKTPLEVTITLPGTGDYVLNQSITATWSATDALSGVISPVSGSVSIDTSSVGTKTFTLPAGTATDKAGNSSLKVTKSYSVIADTEDPEMIYPQQWAIGTGTVGDPWAGSCIEDAYAACPTGGTIYLRAGYYQLAGQVNIRKAINIIGEGIGKTIVLTANAHGFDIESCDYVTIKNLTIDADAQTTTGETYLVCIPMYEVSYAILENLELKNSVKYGIDANSVNHSLFQNIHSHDHYRYGMHPGTTQIGWNMYNTYRDIYCWNNGWDGIDDIGNESYPDEDLYNIWDNIQCWDNGRGGIVIHNQRSGIISNSSASGNGTVGLHFQYLGNFNIHDCSATLNGDEGIWIRYNNNLNFTNVIVKNNNVSDGWKGGILVRGSNGTRFTSCQSYDDRETPLQYYGLMTEDAVDYIELVNCKLLPNKTSAIYNYAEAVIIEEIKLARF